MSEDIKKNWENYWIRPDWRAPRTVHAYTTTRDGGVSEGAYASLNLASHVGDSEAAVAENRKRVSALLSLPAEPHWLTQVHGNVAVRIDDGLANDGACSADAAISFTNGFVCAVLTADCVPVFLCDKQGERVGLAHAGWKGLSRGVIESTIAGLERDPEDLMAWMGPAIGPRAFRVGDEVRDAFKDDAPAFTPDGMGAWMADLYLLVYRRLERLNVGAGGGGFCTYNDPRFYSYRRDKTTGRMASLIWLE